MNPPNTSLSSDSAVNPEQFYTDQEHFFADRIAYHKGITRRISLARLCIAVMALVSGFASWNGGIAAMALVPLSLWYGVLGFSFAMFLILVTMHARHHEQLSYAEGMHRVVKRELAALAGDFSEFSHGGEFLTERDVALPHAEDFALDLDIFGEHSLFQRINRTVTPLGYKRLAEYLTTTLQDVRLINSRNESLRELAADTHFRHEWLASEAKQGLAGQEQQGIQRWLDDSVNLSALDVLGKTWFTALLVLLPIMANGVGVWGGVMPDSGLMRFFWAFVIAHFGIWAIFFPRIRRETAMMSRTASLLAQYVRLLRLLQNHSRFHSPILQRCASEADVAAKSLRKLTLILRVFENSQSPFGAILLNGLFLWDVHCIRLLSEWRKRYGTRIEEWFEALAEMDALVSMAGFVFRHPEFVPATIRDADSDKTESFKSSSILAAEGLYHPFLPQDEAVKNSLTLSGQEGKLVIITGANMAGKSTFLRALALNTVLAHIGLPVAAERFSCSVMHVVTSMRTSDSLERHESYFFAELQRLKMITERLRSGAPMLIILDEILRGTNSADKKSGTIGLLRQMIAFPSLAVIATHDTEIGLLEQEFPSLVRNFCFEGVMKNNDLYFDYTLRSGVAANKNATFLMQKMGILLRDV